MLSHWIFTLQNVGSFCIKAIEIYFLIMKKNRKRFRDWLGVVDYFERRKHIELSKSLSFEGGRNLFWLDHLKSSQKFSSDLDNIAVDSNKQRINATCFLESSSAFGYLHFFVTVHSQKLQAIRLFIARDQRFTILSKYHNASEKLCKAKRYLFCQVREFDIVSWCYESFDVVELYSMFFGDKNLVLVFLQWTKLRNCNERIFKIEFFTLFL